MEEKMETNAQAIRNLLLWGACWIAALMLLLPALAGS
jgi:hypothetical protein